MSVSRSFDPLPPRENAKENNAMSGRSRTLPLSAMLAALACLAAVVCRGFGFSSFFDDDGKILNEPAGHAKAARYAARAESLDKTKSIPVEFEVSGTNLHTTVSSISAIGSSSVSGSYAGRAIIAREFEKFRDANFDVPRPGVKPAVKMSVKIKETSDESSYRSGVSSKISLVVEFSQCDGPGMMTFSVEKTATAKDWPDKDSIPPSFFNALAMAVDGFVAAWESGGGPAALEEWHNPSPDCVPPELKSFKWLPRAEGDEVHFGECVVACNGYEPFAARKWAEPKIFEAARKKLGNIEYERVRVVYDVANLDSQEWAFRFRAFARSRTVFSFDKMSRRGSITGDLELMGFKDDESAASEELESIVKKEAGRYAGLVESGKPKPESSVRFDNHKTDKAFGLVTITFRLL